MIFYIRNNYILIPFDTCTYNEQYNNTFLQQDILSMKYSEDFYISLNIGNPIQTIKLLLRLDDYETIIKEPNYNSSSSNSFKLNKIIQNKYICNDTFHLITINSSKELNDYLKKDKNKRKNIEPNLYRDYKDFKFIYLNESMNYNFLEKELLDDDIKKIKADNYGMIGLRLRHLNVDSCTDIIKSLNEMNAINVKIFTFLFNNKKNDEHYGYLIIGDKVIDIKKEFEETYNIYYAIRSSGLSWDLRTESIYSESKMNSKKIHLYLQKNSNVELNIEKSYILGNKDYKLFIEDAFFNDLVKDNICQYKNLLVSHHIGSYVCDSKSKLFQNYYKNNFPNLFFKCNNLIDDLILTKKDLFFYNEYNKSDTNIYFNIFFSTISTTRWMLGRTFFQKYRFSFNFDTSFLMYHKKIIDEDEDEIDNENNNKNNNLIKIIIVIFLVFIIFFFGYLFHRLITKVPRKQKANELDDEFDYTISKDKKLCNDLDINTNKISNKNNQYLELGSRNI